MMTYYAVHLVRWEYNIQTKEDIAIDLGFYVLYPNGDIHSGPMTRAEAESLALWCNDAPHPPGTSREIPQGERHRYREAIFSARGQTVYAQRLDQNDAPWVKHGTLEWTDKGQGAYEVKVLVLPDFVTELDPPTTPSP
ncbi:hypothetical protein [Azospirillum argentinense]